uniref:Uncharacterized protein n=1 Tax=Neobodo designis TaxID=312471 RepID=A0A7S1M0F8_NEODS|mmetsp:Transcript_31610/g.97683  ORF Transcript_31610/g.97683 Transcript_31610/m.97683 type:complete len:314 (+) Transcript_31610:151-1092(+)|eukprot:CAMPEP_0174853544 /NCGR_PEP_ID=MMETSP1114-20130205/28897_1 /TAXON_ID=312471 /ORGANISM="Neobodo designis, Strain CCAP 1951/1" /LENGTH=313 /DNA_ID=CAMNT_0016088199 /DNA_START=151 /DNA_END=1092 /DNA_ORIENTATION=-
MGFFGKDRTGTVETVTTGRRFIWHIPDIEGKRFNTVLDSALVNSFQGVEFHFHLIIGLRGDIGFYVHHKRERIPKYSFFFAVGGANTERAGRGTVAAYKSVMRQHTAHTIPVDTERCGHWNVCNMDDLKQQQPEGGDGSLDIVFTFDNDVLAASPIPGEDGAKSFTWVLPSPTARCLTPFTSHSFTFNGVYYVIRIDKKAGVSDANGDDIYSAFVFSRTGLVPPHDVQLSDQRDGAVLLSLPRTEDMSTQLMTIPAALFEREAVKFTVTMHRGGNPLDVLNAPPAELEDKKEVAALAEDDKKAKKYGIAMDDL